MEVYYHVVVLWLIFVQAQGISVECQHCGCCRTGRSYKCGIGDYCQYGCLDGYWGDKCDHKCRYTNCAICNSNRGHSCQECKTGYYGYNCGDWCGSHCKTCQKWMGCIECNNGYYGANCQHSCGYNCLECNKQSGCIGCMPGYYLKNSACMKCQNTGCTCFLNSQCQGCIDGYFLQQKLCEKCPNNCIKCVNSTKCTSCTDGWFGNRCQFRCTQNCVNGKCVSTNAVCNCNAYYIGETCEQCVAGYFGNDCKQKCSTGCYNTCSETDGSCTCKSGWTGDKCDTCDDKHYGDMCEQARPQCCKACEKEHGSCLTCRRGYFGEHCNMSCAESCLSCKQYDVCSECKPGYSNTNKLCTCKTDICKNSVNCSACTNTSFYPNDGECCLCHLENCVSCIKRFDSINCQTCKNGYYPQTDGQCKTCNLKCVNNDCDSSSGKCLQGCTTGYWKQTCDKLCNPKCDECSQADGSCTTCKNNSAYGPNCEMKCSSTCKSSMCDVNGDCTNGCITNMFGKQCEYSQTQCEVYCSSKENRTICSEKTGMCLYGCKSGYSGPLCPQGVENTGGKQTTMTAAVGASVSGGIVALIILAILAIIWFRKRRMLNSEGHNSRNNGNNDSLNVDQIYYSTMESNLRG